MKHATTILVTALLLLLFAAEVIAQGPAHNDTPTHVPPQTVDTQLWRINFDNDAQLNSLVASLDIWEVDHEDRSALALLTEAQVKALTQQGWQIFAERQLPIVTALTPADHHVSYDYIPGYPCYRTTQKTESDMKALAQAYPNLAVWVDIGNSWDKTNISPSTGHDIHALVLTNRTKHVPKFRFLVVAEVHARELVTTEIAARFAEHLLAQYGIDPDVTWLLDYGEAHIIPLANPDGRRFADQLYYWRKNTNSADGCSVQDTNGYSYGVDLNRNFGFGWNTCGGERCSSRDPCSPTYRGLSAASEPETRALQRYAKATFPDQRAPGLTASAPITTTGLMLSLHSYAEMIIYPWAFSSDAVPNATELRELGMRLAEPLQYDVCQTGESGCLYLLDGDFADWSYGTLGVASYTFEFGTEFFQQCQSFEGTILDPAITSLKQGFKYARLPYASTAAPQITRIRLAQQQVQQGNPVTVTATLSLSSLQSSDNVGIQYSLDAPSWATDPKSVVKVYSSDFQDKEEVRLRFELNTDSWHPGRHLLFFEGIDQDGNVGVPTAAYVHVGTDTTWYLPMLHNFETKTAE